MEQVKCSGCPSDDHMPDCLLHRLQSQSVWTFGLRFFAAKLVPPCYHEPRILGRVTLISPARFPSARPFQTMRDGDKPPGLP